MRHEEKYMQKVAGYNIATSGPTKLILIDRLRIKHVMH